MTRPQGMMTRPQGNGVNIGHIETLHSNMTDCAAMFASTADPQIMVIGKTENNLSVEVQYRT
jgi:hypothetical protein